MKKRPAVSLLATSFATYTARIQDALKSRDATEHTHRPALKDFVESIEAGVIATNEPKRIAAGAPDFNVRLRTLPIGHIETKDIGVSLDDMSRGRGPSAQQFRKYVKALPNWVLTDYVEFRWYVDGALRDSVTIGRVQGRTLSIDPNAEHAIIALFRKFLAHEAPLLNTSRDLAQHLAGLAQIIDEIVTKTFGVETSEGYLHQWFDALQTTLIPDLKADSFGDMFAQTLVYGLFAARLSTPATAPFTRATAPFSLPKSNPFLRKFFAEVSGVDMPDTLEWAVDDVIAVLNRVDVETISRDFERTTGHDDPVVHFYETFLAAYKPRQRELRGVYYTPRPVVNYIVRSVDEILRSQDFNVARGLADQNTLILDPAVGTATFIYAVIDLIREQFSASRGAWPKYVRDHLLRRLFGFELLMAPYAVAHLKIALQLERDYKFSGSDRVGIFLTNSLEGAGPSRHNQLQKFISDEAHHADEIKNNEPILVVLGNPPYRGVSVNKSRWIQNLIDDYRVVDGEPLGERKVWLQNDYVKFIRFAEWRIQQTKTGVVAFITDNSYLDSPTFRGMRQHLMATFDRISVYNLHGSTMRRETSPSGSRDMNVFDIQQGVSIAFFVKLKDSKTRGPCLVEYADLYGVRDHKYSVLERTTYSSTAFETLTPTSPAYNFVPVDTDALASYERGMPIDHVFEVGSNGVQTSRDHLVVDFDAELLAEKLKPFGNPEVTTAEIRRTLFAGHKVGDYPEGDMSEFSVATARRALQADRSWKSKMRSYLYRPFDERKIVFADYLIHRPRREVMQHFDIPNNLALCVGRAGLVKATEWTWSFVTTTLVDHNIFYRGSSQNYPLYVRSEGDLLRQSEVRVNINPTFLNQLSQSTGLHYDASRLRGNLRDTLGPRDAFDYIYSILNTPAYRLRYREYLDKAYPRIPFPDGKKTFVDAVRLGTRLIDLHTLAADDMDGTTIRFPVTGSDEVRDVTYDPESGRVYINDAQYFTEITDSDWALEFGGYPVLFKWLDDRKGWLLSFDEITMYQRIVQAVQATIEIGTSLDSLLKAMLS